MKSIKFFNQFSDSWSAWAATKFQFPCELAMQLHKAAFWHYSIWWKVVKTFTYYLSILCMYRNSNKVARMVHYLKQKTGNWVCIRCLMVSTNQADPGCFYFRISWILMEGRWFYYSSFNARPQKPQTLIASKINYENFDQKFRFLIKK